MRFFAQMNVLLLLVLGLCLSLPVLALPLEEAKAQLEETKQAGTLGEKSTGYLGVVKAEGQAAAIAEAINQARRQEYQRIAAKHGIDLTEVEVVAGKKAIEKTPPGQYVMVEGRWLRK